MTVSVPCASRSLGATGADGGSHAGDPRFHPNSAYVHVPFCAHKCGYCDFASVAGQDERADEYLDALECEMRSKLPESPLSVRTIFVGGGTPTYLSASQLRRLLEIIGRRFCIDKTIEFTVESNPNTLTAEKVDVLADYKVNRVSLGAQSFHQRLLTTLERNHDPDSVAKAVDMVRKRIDAVSLDLIFGVPGQTFVEWEADLDRLIALNPDHCSTYGLTYEKGTRLWKQRSLGVVQPVDEDLERRMYEHAIDRLAQRGFLHYEISNFARNDATETGKPAAGRDNRCLHNLTYWANHAYHGFGTGAAAYVGGTRTLNIRDLSAYIHRCRSGSSPATQSETLDPETRARETAMLQLRRLQGVNCDDFQSQTGFAIEPLFRGKLPGFLEMGFLKREKGGLALTRDGLPLADGILQAVL